MSSIPEFSTAARLLLYACSKVLWAHRRESALPLSLSATIPATAATPETRIPDRHISIASPCPSPAQPRQGLIAAVPINKPAHHQPFIDELCQQRGASSALCFSGHLYSGVYRTTHIGGKEASQCNLSSGTRVILGNLTHRSPAPFSQ